MSLKKILVYGGKGALGSTIVKHFKSLDWWVVNVDFSENSDSNANIIVKGTTMVNQEKVVHEELSSILSNAKLDAVICVAGGWAGGNLKSDDYISNSELMIGQSIYSSCIAAKMACLFMNDGGLLVLTGAKAALEPCPSMIGYGLAKSAVHYFTKTLAQPDSGMPENSCVCAILPTILDTPMNRKWMPKANKATWTPLDFVANTISEWITGERPKNGSLVALITEDSKTKLEVQ